MPPPLTSASSMPNPRLLEVRPLAILSRATEESAPASRSQRLKQWWNTLLRTKKPTPYFNANIVKPNDSGILCPDNPATIRINRSSTPANVGKPIHASRFTIEREVPAKSATPAIQKARTYYAIGQSPHQETYEDFLVAGLESGLGLYQFVSERTLSGKTSRSNTAIIQLLENRLAELKKNGNQTLKLGNRFTVKKLEPVLQDPAIKDCGQYRLTVTDSANNQEITVPITLAGLRFDNAVLSATTIERASDVMDQHHGLLANSSVGAGANPLILSHAGYGRNATLMTYRDVCLHIAEGTVTTEKEIEQRVQHFIEEQRKVRPGFVHSLAQVEQLQNALLAKLPQRWNLAASSAAGPSIQHARPQSPARVVTLPHAVQGNNAAASAAPTPVLGTRSGKMTGMQVDGLDNDVLNSNLLVFGQGNVDVHRPQSIAPSLPNPVNVHNSVSRENPAEPKRRRIAWSDGDAGQVAAASSSAGPSNAHGSSPGNRFASERFSSNSSKMPCGPTNINGDYQFHDAGDTNGIFSNFWDKHPFKIDNVEWKSVEHYFQAQKFRNLLNETDENCPSKLALRKAIQNARTPGDTKDIAQSSEIQYGVHIEWKKVWDPVRVGIMYKAVFAKFSQNPALKQALLETKNAQLIETMPKNRRDTFWGAVPNGNGTATGVNMLGRILAQVRDDLNGGAAQINPDAIFSAERQEW